MDTEDESTFKARQELRYALMERKFIMAGVGLVVSAGLLLIDKIDGSEFVMLTLGLAGAYMTANVFSK